MMARHIRSLLFAGIVATSAACGPGTAPVGQPPMAVLTPASIESFREAFNQTADQTRVILLLSPT